MSIYTAAAAAVAAVFLGLLFQNEKKEYGLLLSIGICCVIFVGSIGKLQTVIDTLMEMKELSGLDSAYLVILLKMIGIAYVAEFSAGLCRDSGYSAVASQIELFGKLSLLGISMPVLQALLETVCEMLEG
jgi:stage III sporulation protein AD